MADNYATHRPGDVHKWLAKHPRFQMHVTHALCLESQGGGDPPQDSPGYTGADRITI